MKAGIRNLRSYKLALLLGLLITMAIAAPVCAAVVITESFESSTWNTNWTGNTLPDRVAAPAPGHGSYSLRQSSAPQRATRNNFTAVPANTPVAVRFYFYDTNGAYDNFVDIRNAGASQIFAMGNQNQHSNYDYRLLAPSAGSNGWSTTDIARTYDAWKKLEIYYDGSQHATWLVDSAVALDRTDITNMGVAWENVVCGNGSGTGTTNYSYIDDLSLIRDPKKVTIGQSPTGGTVSGTVGGSAFPVLTGYYGDGEVINLTATPTGSDYVFQKWVNGSGGTISTNPTFAYTVTTATAQTVNAVFVINGYTLTTNSCPTAGGATTPGYQLFQTSGPATATATAVPGYKFTGWSNGACGGAIVSTSSSYSFAMPLTNVALYANFAPRLALTTYPCPTTGATTTPALSYQDAGDSVTATAVVKPGYTWQYWTDDSCSGTHVVSTSLSYSFAMPNNDLGLYAHVTPGSYMLTRMAGIGGGVSGSSGMTPTDTSVTVIATPTAGYQFLGWTTDTFDGVNYVSTSPTYTFNMPPNALTLYANFWHGDTSKGLFVDTFESYATGGASFDSIDKNDTAGPNTATNGAGNPWWGSNPPNGRVNAALGHWSAKSLWGTAGNCKDMVNLQYRANSGSAITGSVYLDWWFYDPFGPGGTTGSAPNFCGDYTALSYYTGIPSGSDYPSPVPNPMTGNLQQLAIGMSNDLSAGYDPATYQVRIVGDAGGYHNGWFNTAVGRSVGWHHARVVIGPRKTPSNTNDVIFYIDSMGGSVLAPRDSITANGFNILEVNTIMPVADSVESSSGALYSKYFHYSSIDNVCFGVVPNAPTPIAAGPITIDRISWNWIDNSSNENGFNVWDAAGSVKCSAPAGTGTALDGCLLPNTQYSRWLDSFITQYCGNVDGPKVALAPVYTLALPPVYGTAGTAAVSCSRGPGSTTSRYTLGTATTFTAVNGFGPGQSRASKYLYIWDKSSREPSNWASAPQWTSGTLSQSPTAEGAYYLHLRACNGDGVDNPAIFRMGPYIYDNSTPIAKISDLWPLPDSATTSYSLSGKTVSGVWTDGFWIEEANRCAGIKVLFTGTPVGAGTVSAGDLIDVTGTLSSGDERVLNASIVIDQLVAPSRIAPLLMTERYLTGNNAYNPIVTGAKGIYGVGLLVKVAGSAGNAGGGYFYLDDGSGAMSGTIKGIKVICGSLTPPSSGNQVVTGVIGVVNHDPVIYALSIQAR